jgi:CRISPR-associated protein Csx10
VGEFCVVSEIVYEWENHHRVNVHTQRDAQRGRATKENGAVYRYEALPAGTKLRGIVLTQNEDYVNEIKELLLAGTTIHLGKARTAGYGSARIHSLEALPEDWREVGRGWEPDSTKESFTLTFLSEGIVRDENGQHSLDITHALRARLGVSGIETTRNTVFRRQAILGGFNRKWNLPLP